MRLSELKTGERAVIVKVAGHGGFRKRIVEMGFIKGKTVEVVLNAPLEDPVKYRLMGYEVSLRRQEASLIEVLPASIPASQEYSSASVDNSEDSESQLQWGKDEDYHAALVERRTINVALVGNPNCGKTSLFNFASGAHARVGNYSGVTVDATEARALFFGYEFILVDLPGTYSLSCYSPEELYVRRHLTDKLPDVVINVLDASNLERNLYLTTQLLDMDIPMVCALNMYDEFERRGDSIDIQTLSTLFGAPMVRTSFKEGRGVRDLFRAVIQVYEGVSREARHLHINYGHEIEDGIRDLQQFLKQNNLQPSLSTRYVAIKLMEGDKEMEDFVDGIVDDGLRSEAPETWKSESKSSGTAAWRNLRDRASARVEEESNTDAETAIMDAKYGFINGVLTEARYATGTKEDTYRMTHIIDGVLSNKYVGFPIFFLILFVMFETTFVLGQYPMDWIEWGVEALSNLAGRVLPEGPVHDMIVDGIIGGVGAVIVFLPQILILYLFISFMEDSGYMARAAFIMDKLMHKMGLHGKSFIPLIMGFGCNVPAVMATRTIESRRSRLITMMILPFMSCSARLPIYIMVTGTFFALRYRSLVMISLYAVGIAVAVVVSRLFSRFVIKGEDTPFVMELPPYRMPTRKAILRHTWEKGKEYLKKMGGIILVASIVVWALGYFGPVSESGEKGESESSLVLNVGHVSVMEDSYIGIIGRTIEPLFKPQGFNWKLDVSLVAGLGAKEIVASTIGVIYSGDDSFGDDSSYSDDISKYERLHQLMVSEGITPLAAYCYLLFVLLYFPCMATIVAIKNETGSWRWAVFAAVYTTSVAWIISAATFQIGCCL